MKGDDPSSSGACAATAAAGESSSASAVEFGLAGVAAAAYGTVSEPFAISPPGSKPSPCLLSFEGAAEHRRSL